MGLDAYVYCNCFETGYLRSPSRPDFKVLIDDDGGLYCQNSELEVQLAFDQWLDFQACEHQAGVLLHHKIGNISLVALLRRELMRESEQFPIILSKVIYSGTHCCDFLSMEEVRLLQLEMPQLKQHQAIDPTFQSWLNEFHHQLEELIECSLRVNKPITF